MDYCHCFYTSSNESDSSAETIELDYVLSNLLWEKKKICARQPDCNSPINVGVVEREGYD